MNIEKVTTEIKELFWLANQKIISVDECFVLFNKLRKELKLSDMSREQFDVNFYKASIPQPEVKPSKKKK